MDHALFSPTVSRRARDVHSIPIMVPKKIEIAVYLKHGASLPHNFLLIKLPHAIGYKLVYCCDIWIHSKGSSFLLLFFLE
jgi:hypothetical protein